MNQRDHDPSAVTIRTSTLYIVSNELGNAREGHLMKVNVIRSMAPTRRRFLEFLVSVAAVHVVALVLYYALDVGAAPPSRQRVFAWVWMAATVAVVFVGLQRIKRARRESRGAR